MKLIIAVAFLATATSALSQVPPPPPANDTLAVAATIKDSYKSHDLKKYRDIIADNIVVYRDDGRKIEGKLAWIDTIGPMINNPNIVLRVDGQYLSPVNIVNIESYNTAATFNSGRVECCWSTDVLKYTIKNGRISYIYIMPAGQKKSL